MVRAKPKRAKKGADRCCQQIEVSGLSRSRAGKARTSAPPPGTTLDLAFLSTGTLGHAERYRNARDQFITSHPDILGCTPVIDGTRIPVHAVLGRFQGGETLQDLIDDDPEVPPEAFEAAELYARAHPLRGRPSGRPWRNAA